MKIKVFEINARHIKCRVYMNTTGQWVLCGELVFVPIEWDSFLSKISSDVIVEGVG